MPFSKFIDKSLKEGTIRLPPRGRLTPTRRPDPLLAPFVRGSHGPELERGPGFINAKHFNDDPEDDPEEVSVAVCAD